MKIRIRGNSIRLRLMQSEVEAFAENGGFKEEINFGETALEYGIYLMPDIEAINVKFKGNRISVMVPEATGRQWANSDIVGMEHQQLLFGKEYLYILIEKDFKCLSERQHEDESDAFPNPVADQSC